MDSEQLDPESVLHDGPEKGRTSAVRTENIENTFQPVSTMPEGVDCWCIQETSLGSPAPFLMSREGDVFFWEPEGYPATVVPTHWAPHEPGKPAPWPQEDLS